MKVSEQTVVEVIYKHQPCSFVDILYNLGNLQQSDKVDRLLADLVNKKVLKYISAFGTKAGEPFGYILGDPRDIVKWKQELDNA